MTADHRPAITWRQASVGDSLAAADVFIRSWQASFPGRQAQADDLSIDRRAVIFRRRFGAAFYRMYVAEARERGVVGFVDVGDIDSGVGQLLEVEAGVAAS